MSGFRAQSWTQWRSGRYPLDDVLSINPRPTRMHELLDIDTFQPFEFKGTMYYLDGVGRVQKIEDSWTSTKEFRALPLVDPDILTAIINEPDKVWRTRIVDHVSIMRHLKALGMKYILRLPSLDDLYLFKSPKEGTSFEALFDWPSDILKKTCDLYVPTDSSLRKDLSIIMRGVFIDDLVWRGEACKFNSYALNIDEYLNKYGDTKPIYERIL